MKVHELRVVVNAVEHLWVDWLCHRSVEIAGLRLARRKVQADMHGVRALIVVQNVAEGVPFRLVRKPKGLQVPRILLGAARWRRWHVRSG